MAKRGVIFFFNDTFLRSIYFSAVNYVYCHKKFIIQATGQTRHEDVLPWMRIASGKQDIIFAFIVFLSDLTMMTSSSGNHFLSLTSPETFLSITFENYLRRIFIPLPTSLTRKKMSSRAQAQFFWLRNYRRLRLLYFTQLKMTVTFSSSPITPSILGLQLF